VESRLVFRFKDGSLYDERVTFSQKDVFTLLSYHIVQQGPSFPEALDGRVDRRTGTYEVRIKSESYAYNRRVPSEDKIYRVSVKAGTNVWGTTALIGGLLLLVVGIVVLGLKLTRR